MRYALITMFLAGLLLYASEETALSKERKSGDRPRCIVCGMYADIDTLWMTEIELIDGTKLFFESPLHGFQFYLNPENYTKGSVNRENIKVFIVRDFFTHKKLRADSAFFIVDSNLKGPMGRDLLPVNKKDAVKLREKYKGKIMKFSDITREFIKKYKGMMKMEKEGMK